MFSSFQEIFSHSKDNNYTAFIFGKMEITWMDFCSHVNKLSKKLSDNPKIDFLLYCEDTFLFAVGFFALLHAKKSIILPPNSQGETLKEIASGCTIITDIPLSYDESKIIYVKYEDNLNNNSSEAIYFDEKIDSAKIIFYTSGSTGQPKKIIKNLYNLTSEISELEALWGKDIKPDSLFASTVSHQHIYGLLFRFLWPILRGNTIESSMIFSPEALIDIAGASKNITLVSSPAFLKRICENAVDYEWPQNINTIFSSGGLLEKEVSKNTNLILKSSPWEILGSTETGGIAYRTQKNSDVWKTFPKVKIKTDSEKQLSVSSPYIFENEYIATGDTIDLIDESSFKLQGRIGRIVKIEEKRISLAEIEDKLKLNPMVKDCHSLVLKGHRQIIGTVVILNQDGEKLLQSKGKWNFNKIMREYLLQYFEPVVIPRKWRYITEIRRNSQGKILHTDMLKLFDTPDTK